MALKRGFLLGVVASLSVAALMGIFVLLGGSNFGEFEGKVLASTMSVGFFCLTALCTAIVMEKGVWRPAMVACMTVSALGLATYLAAIWILFDLLNRHEEVLFKTMFVQGVWAVAIPHAGLLALTRFNGSLRWARILTLTLIPVLAAWLSVLVVFDGFDSAELTMRVTGVLIILVALGTIALPVLFKVKGIERLAMTESTPLTLRIVCPRCLTEQTISNGHSRCVRCRLRFHIEIEEPRCPRCNYLLHQLTQPRCPECGQPLSEQDLPQKPAVAAHDTPAT